MPIHRHETIRKKVIWGVRRKFVWTCTAFLALISIPASAQQLTADQAAPITTELRFKLATQRSLVGIGTSVASGLWQDPSPERIAISSSNQFAISATDHAVASMLTTAVLPTVFHQDPRYFSQSGQHGVASRIGYAASRVLVTRGESGRAQFNMSMVGGTMGAVGISSLYNPSVDTSATGALTEAGTRLLWAAASNELREFWPDIRHALFRH